MWVVGTRTEEDTIPVMKYPVIFIIMYSRFNKENVLIRKIATCAKVYVLAILLELSSTFN